MTNYKVNIIIIMVLLLCVVYFRDSEKTGVIDVTEKPPVFLSIINSSIFKVYEDSLKEYITIPQLKLSCNLPGKCSEKLECEDKEVKVKGFVDFGNIFDKEHYPQLPYEKFRIYDSEKTSFLEVWTPGDDNSAIFEKIYDNNVIPVKMIFIRAKIEGVDIQTNKGCKRWIKLIINSEENIFFQQVLILPD